MNLSKNQISELKYSRKSIQEYSKEIDKIIKLTILGIGIDPKSKGCSIDYLKEYLKGEIDLKNLRQILKKVRN